MSKVKAGIEELQKWTEAGMDLYCCEDKLGNIFVYRSNGVGFSDSNDLQHNENNKEYWELDNEEQNDNSSIQTIQPHNLTSQKHFKISSRWGGGVGAIELIGSDTLQADTVFYRYISSPSDFRYTKANSKECGELSKGTYLTTELDSQYANTGFATVGRMSLPLPIPASYVFQYLLKAGTKIQVGTVQPAFGQSGGGVEIKLSDSTDAQLIGKSIIPDY